VVELPRVAISVIRCVILAHLLGDDEARTLPVLSSGVAPRPGKNLNDKGGWKIAFRDDRQVP
jgi:hypothetical protein